MSPIDLTRRELLVGAGAIAVAHLLPQQQPPAAPANPRATISTLPPSTTKPPTLWVNGTTGNDSNTRAQVAAGGGSVAWRTISRAAKGCAPGGTPNAAEAAQAGDVVSIAAGTYATTGLNSRWNVAYNPVNSGTGGNLITFQANGTVTLTYSSGIGPVIGAFGVNYIQWIGFSIDEANAPSASDTGPVVFNSTTGSVVDRCILDGNGSRFDNHNGVRLEHATNCIVRNCVMHDFVAGSVNATNGNGICHYDCTDCVYEHNEVYACGSGIFFKGGNAGAGSRVRYNHLHNNGLGLAISYNTSAMQVYQNLIVNNGSDADNAASGLQHGSGSPAGVLYVNNTLVNNKAYGFYLPGDLPAAAGVKLYNNIIVDARKAIVFRGSAPGSNLTKAQLDAEHNCYHGFTIGCVDIGYSMRALSQWQSEFSQDAATPASFAADPGFTNEAGGDYTLRGGSPCLNAGIDTLDLLGGGTNRPINMGCYVTGTETMGPQ